MAAVGLVVIGFSAELIDYRNRTSYGHYDISAVYYNETSNEYASVPKRLLGRPTRIEFTSFITTLSAGIVCTLVGVFVGSLVITHRYSLLKLQLADTQVWHPCITKDPSKPLG